jgi:glycosyltransferase involved in cell wall biosynthesis
MENSFELVIVIPAFNEATRLCVKSFKTFLKAHPKVLICFVNDGSTDDTEIVINNLKTEVPYQLELISPSQNQGKAEAVRIGMLVAYEKWCFQKIAYLDADLSTSLEECYEIAQGMSHISDFAFGSRISKLDSQIHRKLYRFLIGRSIATLISSQLKLNVYDTQCGCKVLRRDLLLSIFETPFISKWLFDVEIFHRLITIYGREQLKRVANEIPLKSWQDTDDSRVPLSYFFRLWIDLRAIKIAYQTNVKSSIFENETILE